ncbi:MAG TPA: hypothetical protein VEV17_01495 [Bryobacteraceae bacterium]|nr:hypothetical protein [Bryobacteraceae bacterium]
MAETAPARGGLLGRFFGPAILLLIVIGFFWKLLLTDQYSWLQAPDLAYQVLPWLDYQARQFHQHHFPIWDPFLFGGQSLIGQAQPGLAYPPNWLLFLAPLDRGHISTTILNWYYMAIHYLAALFCYLLCRDLGRSVAGSVLAGVAFGLGGYIGTTDWPQMINGAVWAPLVFLFLFRVARGVRPLASAAFSGLFLGVSWLSGHHQVPIFLTLAAGGVWLYLIFHKGRPNWPLIKPAAVFAAFLVLTGAFQMWPAYAYGQTAVRWAGAEDALRWNQAVPYSVHQRYGLSPILLIGVLIPGYGAEVSPYTGVVALVLAGIALACCWKTREVRVLTAVGIAGLLYALAKNDVFQGILYSVVPMVEKARSPGVAICLFHFAIAVLLAFGLDALFLSTARPPLRRIALALAGFGAILFLLIFGIDLAESLNWQGEDRVMITSLAAFALAGLIYRCSRNETVRTGLLVLIIGLYIVEIGNVSLYALPHKDEKNRNVFLKGFDDTQRAADFLQSQPGPVRLEVNGDDVSINLGDWYGIDTSNGYSASLPINFNELEIHTPRTKMLYGVNYTLSKKPNMEGQQEVFRDNNGLLVFKNPNTLPRVWTVHEAVQVASPREARGHLQDPNFDLRKKTFGYAAPPAMDRCDGDAIRYFSRGINSSTVQVDMQCRGMVVQSENDAPGWIARVDGKETPIYEAYTALRGVVVGPGKHKIEMRYRPLSVVAGGAATLSAFLGALALCAAGWLRRESPRI